jgi:hypothetical protein
MIYWTLSISFYTYVGFLKDSLLEVKPYLHLERPVARLLGKLAERSAAVYARVGAFGRTEHSRDRAERLRMVEDVGGVDADLESDAFPHLEPLRDRHVRSPRSLARDVVLSEGAALSWKRIPENDVACLVIPDGSQCRSRNALRDDVTISGSAHWDPGRSRISRRTGFLLYPFFPDSVCRVDVKRSDDVRRTGANDHALGGNAIRET